MTNYLPDGSSEYCVCGHSAKDHQIRHVEGKNTFERYEEDGRQVTICKIGMDTGYFVGEKI